MTSRYVGRFAPSPTGLLHAGSLVAALASWLDAKAHNGQWLVRIEDIDTPRCVAGADEAILRQLSTCGLTPDRRVVWQSQRHHLYRLALDQLQHAGHVYACKCSRQDIAKALLAQGVQAHKHQAAVYPGTCRRADLQRTHNGPVAWRCALPEAACEPLAWTDRRLGPQQQHLAKEVGDFVLWRKDQLWAYQLAVVIDDAEQGVTHVVRGEDLADNTPRQLWLQRCMGLTQPLYLHTPLVLGDNADKLSKQNGAQALALDTPAQVLSALSQAAQHLGLPAAQPGYGPAEQLQQWVSAWRGTYNAC